MSFSENTVRKVSPVTDFDKTIDQAVLNDLNVEQSLASNLQNLEKIGGVDILAGKLGTSTSLGLTSAAVLKMRAKFGTNEFPEAPMEGFLSLFIGAFNDFILIILIVAACVSIGIGTWQDPKIGYIEGVAILIAVFLVAIVTASNDYSKELQFRALEKSSQEDERTSVIRDGEILRVNPKDIVVGDILKLQAGDMIPADSIVCDHNVCMVSESALTGESMDLKKSRQKDCFLLSSTVITEGEEIKALVIGIGINSQWGKIKANLVSESVNTPLQDKLELMSVQIGYIGVGAAVATFVALIISIWARDNGENVASSVISAFILAIVIIVVAIPEGLPLAVTIALAYSTKKMYQDQCLIRILAACETMGNATNICSDKTGTLTENLMTVVEGWFAGSVVDADAFPVMHEKLSKTARTIIVENISMNRVAYLLYVDSEGKPLHRPSVIGNKTEGALLCMVRNWGIDFEQVKQEAFNEERDKLYAFNSLRKRATAIVVMPDNSVRVYSKGASEVMLRDCTMYLGSDGSMLHLTSMMREELEKNIDGMAKRALRTLVLAHKEFPSIAALPANWRESPPDGSDLCVDCIVGIIDPLRGDVIEAVATAQRAGVKVRMCTGDNIETASAIARQCGILTAGGVAAEGPNFRSMTLKEVDAVLPNLQVLARSSPNDKFLLVTRLNGNSLPRDQEEWETMHAAKAGVSWEMDRDLLLPGYREEWVALHPMGGEVVGVTGDGTNDAPALKAADVGLSMGITGTKVAQGASDIVIMDDRFSSIVKAIMWGRSIYDSIRKFLQFQLTVNIVALTLEFIGAASGHGQSLNAVMMLWVNLVMDTMGALALATEPPTLELLNRKPYKRNGSLISRPMWRNMLCQAAFQLAVLFFLVYYGPTLFGIHENKWCKKWEISGGSSWDLNSGHGKSSNGTSPYAVSCSTFESMCGGEGECYEESHTIDRLGKSFTFRFIDLDDFENSCGLKCIEYDYLHGAAIFNTFVFCQLFNEISSRELGNRQNFFRGMFNNPIFVAVIVVSAGLQIFLVEVGGEFVGTASMTPMMWLITVALAAISWIISFLMRLIPVEESPDSFYTDPHEIRK